LPARIDAFLQSELARRGLDEVTAVEAARWLDEAGLLADSPHRPGLPLRNLLRAGSIQNGEQRPPQRYGRWFIVRRDRKAQPGQSSRSSGATPAEPQTASEGMGGESADDEPLKSEERGHRVTIRWMGKKIETLEDLLRPELRVLCIGINPAETSVERSHYYQGRSGQRFLGRLRSVGLLPAYDGRWEDDVAFELGIGQTDVVKRPTSKADKLTHQESAYGKRELAKRLEGVRAELVIFTYKEAAVAVFGPFAGHGFVRGLSLCGGEVFVMPGPYEKTEVAERALGKLRAWVRRRGLSVQAPDSTNRR
jgi:TDG/mug DNA glycosylase family protein